MLVSRVTLPLLVCNYAALENIHRNEDENGESIGKNIGQLISVVLLFIGYIAVVLFVWLIKMTFWNSNKQDYFCAENECVENNLSCFTTTSRGSMKTFPLEKEDKKEDTN